MLRSPPWHVEKTVNDGSMDLPIIVLCWLGIPAILGSATPSCHRLDKMVCGGGRSASSLIGGVNFPLGRDIGSEIEQIH
ncbi:hypothetical protein M752DRAFT_277907 [Aspergillus phoenicis ATCC 13157]|uniref:Uncharacterized protein n=1 Tax=Aspergillus phoenicis ATCC 13157 TaxID=1353007 RepID=A0A370PCU5_ASPPH|nr:hypothetical protein M752DRAFT_277907 [Aspergillus phoenicis ATCC 13157]